MYCQVHPLEWWSRQWSHGANRVPLFTLSRVPLNWVHFTVPSLGTISPGLYISATSSLPSEMIIEMVIKKT